MRYYSTSETAERWNISSRRVAKLASERRIEGALMVGNNWMIPETAVKPGDIRKNPDSLNKKDLFVFPDLIFGISSKDDLNDLLPDERQLFDGIVQFGKTDYAECIRILCKLVEETSRPCLKIGAYYYLQAAYIAEWQFEKAAAAITAFDRALASANCHKEELLFMKREIDCFRYGASRISKPFDIDIYLNYSKGFLPFISTANAYSDLYSLSADAMRNAVVSHEIICMNLEASGYFYAAMLIHFYIAIMYSISANKKKGELHLKKSLDLALEYENYAVIAFFLGFTPEFLLSLRGYYPEETFNMIQKSSKKRIETSTAFLKYSGGSQMLQMLTDRDLTLIYWAKSGYSILHMAEIKNVSVSSIKKQLNKLYRKMDVSNKRELIKKYNKEMLNLGTYSFHA